MNRVRVKFCGLRRADDIAFAVALGVDAVGLVFVPGSKRSVDIDEARSALAAAPAFVTRVGLFMDSDADHVASVVRSVPLDLLQFHGHEPAEFCTAFGLPYLKAIAMGDAPDVRAAIAAHPRARGILLDAHRSGQQGGSGAAFDWRLIPAELGPSITLAGGLHPENVRQAIDSVNPYAVDVSSGIESAPGTKCRQRMAAFMREVEAQRGRPAG
jgi:phosphoribosylanthranilate isomerase